MSITRRHVFPTFSAGFPLRGPDSARTGPPSRADDDLAYGASEAVATPQMQGRATAQCWHRRLVMEVRNSKSKTRWTSSNPRSQIGTARTHFPRETLESPTSHGHSRGPWNWPEFLSAAQRAAQSSRLQARPFRRAALCLRSDQQASGIPERRPTLQGIGKNHCVRRGFLVFR